MGVVLGVGVLLRVSVELGVGPGVMLLVRVELGVGLGVGVNDGVVEIGEQVDWLTAPNATDCVPTGQLTHETP